MDRIHELNAFIAVVEAGGFSAAARRTGISQSSVSKAIGSLEHRLGVALLHRSTRKVSLTEQGRRYYDRTKPLVEEIADADSELTSSTIQVSGPIRISAGSTFGRLHILPLIPDLLAQHPGLHVDLVLSDFVRDMVDDQIDLAIRVGAVHASDSVVRRVAGTPLVCVGARRYFQKHGAPKIPADLVHHNCLLYGGLRESANWPFEGPAGPFSVAVRGNLSSNSIETIRSGVAAGVGIGLFTRASLSDELQPPKVIAVLGGFLRGIRDVSLVWPKRRFVAARVRRATDYFAAALQRRM